MEVRESFGWRLSWTPEMQAAALVESVLSV